MASQNLLRGVAGEQRPHTAEEEEDVLSNSLPQRQVLKRGSMSKSAAFIRAKGRATNADGGPLTQASSPIKTPLGGRISREAAESKLASKPATPIDVETGNIVLVSSKDALS